jgi:hypothetical protein
MARHHTHIILNHHRPGAGKVFRSCSKQGILPRKSCHNRFSFFCPLHFLCPRKRSYQWLDVFPCLYSSVHYSREVDWCFDSYHSLHVVHNLGNARTREPLKLGCGWNPTTPTTLADGKRTHDSALVESVLLGRSER